MSSFSPVTAPIGKVLAYIQTRTQGIYTGVYNATDGAGTDDPIVPLDLVVTPTSSNSILVLDWEIFGEGSSSMLNYVVKKDGVLLPDSTNGVNGWSALTYQGYDGTWTNTPEPTRVRYIDSSPVAGVAATYSVCARSCRSGVSQPLYLNRCVSSAGGDQYPAGMSTGIAMEHSI